MRYLIYAYNVIVFEINLFLVIRFCKEVSAIVTPLFICIHAARFKIRNRTCFLSVEFFGNY